MKEERKWNGKCFDMQDSKNDYSVVRFAIFTSLRAYMLCTLIHVE